MIKLSLLDKLISEIDHTVTTVCSHNTEGQRPNPGDAVEEQEPLEEPQRHHAAGLMRVDHSGEVCAQALYRGQAFTATTSETRAHLLQAADEENDHLAWTQQRLNELDSHKSMLNPFWYGSSFIIGAGAGLISDRLSYGFVMETENQVMKHLQGHLQALPEHDNKSRAILAQMHTDEGHHAQQASEHGAARLPLPVRLMMKLQSKVMTTTAYYL